VSYVVPYPEGALRLHTDRVSAEDGARQERTAREILSRLAAQPGLILADEVGMGKTFVALAVAAAVALARPDEGPVVVMVPPSLRQKWPKDWAVFREHCLRGEPRDRLRAASAASGVDFLRLLDDPPERRNALVFLTHGALNRALTDEWVKLALIRRALYRRKTVGDLAAEQIRRALPKFAGRILRSQWIDRAAPGLWDRLLDRPPEDWRRLIERAGLEEAAQDDPVPTALVGAIDELDLENVLASLGALPLRESVHVEERLKDVRHALGHALGDLWREWLRRARFRSPLLVFDEAHHLKNPTRLSSLFAEEGAEEDSHAVSRGPLAGVFTRMLFLTATPFQLGHHELIRVLRRFEGIAWDGPDAPPDGRAAFAGSIEALEHALDTAQAGAVRLEQTWGRLTPGHLRSQTGELLTPEAWWRQPQTAPPDDGLVTEVHLRYQQCFDEMRRAEQLLKPWVIRHLKPRYLPPGPEPEPPPRRRVLLGASIREDRPLPGDPGLEVGRDELLPFLLAVRAQVALAAAERAGRSPRAVFAEGLASSYEAYLETRRGNAHVDDDGDEAGLPASADDPELAWYLDQLDQALPEDPEIRARHPKLIETVNRAVRLWWEGEKSLIFCHYRATGRALRRYVSLRLEGEILDRAIPQLRVGSRDEARETLDRLAEQFFDKGGRLASVALETLDGVVSRYAEIGADERRRIIEVALRFLRTPSFLVRYFPLEIEDVADAFRQAFERPDASGLAVHRRIEDLCHFLAKRCVEEERTEYLEALEKIQTGAFRRESADPDDPTDEVLYLPNVRLANGELPQPARRRLMLAFNAPFFPEILIASSVLGEGVDLHLDCRYVVHHDLAWNPSTIEQRTGRVDRIGAKAERARRPVYVYLPFVTATQDEKMFRVVRDRERWFAVVMGEKYQTDEATTDKLAERVPFPENAAKALAFDLSVTGSLSPETAQVGADLTPDGPIH
jgi:superfamily II DNA or RNA helicase